MANKRNQWIRENEKKILSGRKDLVIGASYANTVYSARDAEQLHGTYYYEQQLLELIRLGRTEELRSLLLQYPQQEGFEEGKVALDDLRQVKNIFVALVAMVGKTAAVPGGMPIEQAYYLIDTYSQHCEELSTVEDVYSLQYTMILDFAERVERYQFPAELSPLIRNCTNYIIFHLNEPLMPIDVIEYSGKSRSLLSEKFRDETGYGIGEFITKCKIDEAKSLLRYTDRPISEISSYLSFSSQPYFHNVFRKTTGLTPLQYRNLSV